VKKLTALFVTLVLAMCLSAAAAHAAPEYDMEGLTPKELTVLPIIGMNGGAMLAFKIEGLAEAVAGLPGEDDIHVKVEYQLDELGWNPWFDYSSAQMENMQTAPGSYECQFEWVMGTEWEGDMPLAFRVFCEYSEQGIIGTDVVSGYAESLPITIQGVPGPTGYQGIMPLDATLEPQDDGPTASFLPIEPRGGAESASSPLILGMGLWVFVCVVLALVVLIVVVLLLVGRRKRAR